MASLTYRKDRRKHYVRWHVTVKHGVNAGKVEEGSKSFSDKRKAVLFKSMIEKQEELWASGLVKSTESLETAIKNYHTYITRHAVSTQGLYKLHLDKFIKSLGDDITFVDKITKQHISKFITSMQANKLSVSSCNNALSTIRSFCGFLKDSYGVPDETDGLKLMDKPDVEGRFLSDAEYQVVVEVTENDEYNRDMVLFVSNTGLRASEVCNLEFKNISPDLQSMKVYGKGRKYRVVPLNCTTQNIIKKQQERKHKAGDKIFLSRSGIDLNRHKLYKYCKRIAAQAKIETFGPHALRHHFATSLLVKGVSIQLVSKLLGHTSIQITEKTYIHIIPDHLKGLTDILDT